MRSTSPVRTPPQRPARALAQSPGRDSVTPPAPDPAARRAADAVAVLLALLVLLQVVAIVVPGMWLWGLNAPRFNPPLIAWGIWALGALALVPPISTRVARALDAIDRGPAQRGWMALGIAVPAAAVLLLPDRTWFVGDALLRLSAVVGTAPANTLFPQAMPLDLLLHVDLPRALTRAFGWDVIAGERFVGAVGAAMLGGFATGMARELGLRGATAVAAWAVVACGGSLALLAGYPKGTADLAVVVVAFAYFGAREIRTGDGAAGVALALTAGVLLHRSAVALVPAAVVVAWMGVRRRARNATSAASGRALLWYLIPVAVLAALTPRLLGAIGAYDRPHFLPEGGGSGAILAAALDPVHLADLANLIAALAPLALAAPVLVALLGGRRLRGGLGVLMATISIPWLVGLVLVHPRQGIVRDVDVFVAAGTALGLVSAWLLGETLRRAPSRTWIAVAAAAITLGTTAQSLVLSHDAYAGMRRAWAFVDETPQRPEAHRALALDYLGTRAVALGDREDAARAYARAAALVPSRRILYDWAIAEAERGALREAAVVLERLLARYPDTATAHEALVTVRLQMGDQDGARRAAERWLATDPGADGARTALARLGAPPPTDRNASTTGSSSAGR